jgi:hypothetical protein
MIDAITDASRDHAWRTITKTFHVDAKLVRRRRLAHFLIAPAS